MTATVQQGFELWGWTLLTQQAPNADLTSLLDVVDAIYEARLEGRAAAVRGQLEAECPHACHVLRHAWTAGWRQGRAALLDTLGEVVEMVLH